MIDQYCDICGETFYGRREEIQFGEGKERVEIAGHIQCIDELYDKIMMVKNREKKSVKQVLKEVGFVKV
jgi:hypothetical protein